MKVLLNSFHLNGHTIGFHPQTEKLEPPCTGIEVTVLSFVSSNSPPECGVCGKAIKGKIGKQGYQCRGNEQSALSRG